ncbi:hypothetical protein [Antrihabitans cavernicola]|uniref:Uncharacterized protein n=1 Tax=Antrihabitans cavernicola TaxID=2495913 RepID=A0A5A7S9N6_9NOCA|nr:hypothetical protein [Spelaeibacter cavernicola]KAA0022888.1 hypothetical protein FOY51_10270 [Spelaeibacter cavernicola]
MNERFLVIGDPAERENLSSFVSRALRLDEAVVVRLRRRSEEQFEAWATTGFDTLASRVIGGELNPRDTTVAGDALRLGLGAPKDDPIPLGYSMDSAWRGALPPDTGFTHIDDLPARALVELAQRGVALAKEHGSNQGPPVSLLDQEVVEVTGAGDNVGISMRVVFALTAMGFIPGGDDVQRIDAAELVRVRATKSWLRLDARFGSVNKRRGGDIPLLVGPP